jgi:hypothetical protein
LEPKNQTTFFDLPSQQKVFWGARAVLKNELDSELMFVDSSGFFSFFFGFRFSQHSVHGNGNEPEEEEGKKTCVPLLAKKDRFFFFFSVLESKSDEKKMGRNVENETGLDLAKF